MAETRRKNVMSVELAIQRELAHRKKLVPSSCPSSSLGRNWDSNSSLDLVPISSSPTLRLLFTPSGNTSSIPWLAQNPNLSSSLSLVSSSSNQSPSSTLNPRPPVVPSRIPSPRPGPIPNLVRSPSSTLFPRPPLVPSRVPSPRPEGPRPNLVHSPSSTLNLRPPLVPSPRPEGPRPNLIQSPLNQVSSSNPSPTQRPSSIRSPSTWLRPRPSLSSIKRKASTGNLQPPPPQQPRPSHNNYIKTDQKGIFICKVCEVPCSGASNFKQHLKGQKHKARLQQLQLSREEGKEKKDQRPWCQLCQIGCPDEDALQMHLKGQKHQAKLRELELGKKNGVNQPWCELCQIWCMNEDAFEQHLKGKNHVARLYATGTNKRATGEETATMAIDLEEVELKMIQ
ncbi:uncharacterized protein LOC132286386 [Cornus florida]|uniref:uncharacterized protein LOC132286386 n=1 Tax=Cornus florida TaxID=4283 RepID=UPI00289E7344|nr:uncharacterized protein LOC132286386 [Cornus florida]